MRTGALSGLFNSTTSGVSATASLQAQNATFAATATNSAQGTVSLEWKDEPDWDRPQAQAGVIGWPGGAYGANEIVLGYGQEVDLDIFVDQQSQQFATYHPIGPMAVYVASEQKTFCTWTGADLFSYVGYYDHVTHRWSRTVKASTNYAGDTHGAPAITADKYGYLHVFAECHTTPVEHFKSDSPYDITSWSRLTDIGSACTYPCVCQMGDTIYLFVRTDHGSYKTNSYFKSTSIATDGTITWSAQRDLITWNNDADGYRIYHGGVAPRASDGHIGIQFTPTQTLTNGVSRVGCFYMELDTSTDTIKDVAGNDVGSQLDYTQARDTTTYNFQILSETAGGNQQFGKVQLDSNGIPHVVFGSNHTGTPYLYYTKWNGSGWDSLTAICNIGNWQNPFDFLVRSDTRFDLACITNPTGGKGGDVDYYLFDGASWSFQSKVYDWYNNQGTNLPGNGPNVVYGAGYGGDAPPTDFQFFWSEDNGSDTSNTVRVFGWGDGLYCLSGDAQRAWLPLDEAAGSASFEDQSQHHQTATIMGSPTLGIAGGIGGRTCSRFSSGGYATIPKSALIDHDSETGLSVTVVAWVRKQSGSVTDGGPIVDNYSYPDGYILRIGTPDGLNTDRVCAYVGGSSSDRYTINGSTSIADGTWHLVAFRHAGGNPGTAEVLVDVAGSMTVDASASGNEPLLHVDDVIIGARRGKQDTQYADLDLQDIRIFSRYLTNAELQAIYDAATGGSLTTRKKTA